MATLSVQQITRAGITPSFASCASGGDKFANNGKCHIEVVNASGSSRTVTIVTADTSLDGLAIGDTAVAVAGGTRKKIGPFLRDPYNTTSGYVGLTYSAVGGLTIGVFTMAVT